MSAREVFTTVFGMGTGGVLPLGHRKIRWVLGTVSSCLPAHRGRHALTHLGLLAFAKSVGLSSSRAGAHAESCIENTDATTKLQLKPTIVFPPKQSKIASLRLTPPQRRLGTVTLNPRSTRVLCFTHPNVRKSPRPISNGRLHMLPYFYLHPINLVVYKGTY